MACSVVGQLCIGVLPLEGLVERLDAGEMGVRIELVGDVEGGADFDVFLREVVGLDEDFADWVGVFGILAFVGVVALFLEAGELSRKNSRAGLCG